MIVNVEIKGKKYKYEQVRHIDEHVVHLPKVPSVEGIKIKASIEGVPEHHLSIEELVINLDATVEDAFWNRQYIPKHFSHYIPGHTELWAEETVYHNGALQSLSEEDTREVLYFFDREIHRRKNGLFMVNGDGELEWLSEDHYFFLQWMKAYGVDDGNLAPWRERGYQFGEFRKYQRDVFQLMWKVKNDPNILGLYIAKPKKTGITQILCAYYLNKATLSRNRQMGIMSKGNEAAATNMLFFFQGLDALPQIFKPTTRDRADVLGSIFFSEPAIKSIVSKRGMERFLHLQTANPLNTRVWAAKTKEAGFDSPVMSDVWFDEFAKYDTENKQDPAVVWDRNQETVKLQDYYNGRIWITFYPPETNTKGFFQAKTLYYQSKLSTAVKNPLGRTTTGLITLYISALNAYAGCFDKYGNCDHKLAKFKNKLERDSVKHDPQKYQSKIRQYSETEQECWGATGGGSTFDAVRLNELILDLEEKMKGNRFYIDGKYEWENSLWEISTYDQRPLKTFCPVRFVPLTAEQVLNGEVGRLREYEPIPRNEQNAGLINGYDEKGNLYPPPIITKIGAADPTDLAEGTEVMQGSKNASYTMIMPDLIRDHGRIGSKIIQTEYYFRPSNPWEWYEDLVKEIIYTGKIVIVEANKKWVATQLIKDGLGRFMMVKRKDNGKYALWTPQLEKDPITGKQNYSLLSTETEELESIVRVISRYITKPKEGETFTDYGKAIKSERLLDQMSKFTKEKSKFYDLVMAFGWTLVLMDIMLTTETNNQDNGIYSESMIQAIFEGVMDGNAA